MHFGRTLHFEGCDESGYQYLITRYDSILLVLLIIIEMGMGNRCMADNWKKIIFLVRKVKHDMIMSGIALLLRVVDKDKSISSIEPLTKN